MRLVIESIFPVLFLIINFRIIEHPFEHVHSHLSHPENHSFKYFLLQKEINLPALEYIYPLLFDNISISFLVIIVQISFVERMDYPKKTK